MHTRVVPGWLTKKEQEDFLQLVAVVEKIPNAIAIISEGKEEPYHYAVVLSKNATLEDHHILNQYDGQFAVSFAKSGSQKDAEAVYRFYIRTEVGR